MPTTDLRGRLLTVTSVAILSGLVAGACASTQLGSPIEPPTPSLPSAGTPGAVLANPSWCAGLVLAAVFRADQQVGPGGALEVIDGATGASKRFAADWPAGYHLAPVSGALALVGDDGSVAAHDGDRFPGLEVCDMAEGVIRVVGLGPLPGVSPGVGASEAH